MDESFKLHDIVIAAVGDTTDDIDCARDDGCSAMGGWMP